MGVLRGFLFFCAAGFALAGLVVVKLFGLGIIGLVGLAGGGALAYLTFNAAKNFGVANAVQKTQQLEQIARSLAEKNGGTVAMGAILNATGETKESATPKMRELVGRGVFELDFGANGEMLFKLSPMDEARANLAAMTSTKE